MAKKPIPINRKSASKEPSKFSEITYFKSDLTAKIIAGILANGINR